jgi:hypothetical protein
MPGIGIANAGSPAKILEDEDDCPGLRGRLWNIQSFLALSFFEKPPDPSVDFASGH